MGNSGKENEVRYVFFAILLAFLAFRQSDADAPLMVPGMQRWLESKAWEPGQEPEAGIHQITFDSRPAK